MNRARTAKVAIVVALSWALAFQPLGFARAEEVAAPEAAAAESLGEQESADPADEADVAAGVPEGEAEEPGEDPGPEPAPEPQQEPVAEQELEPEPEPEPAQESESDPAQQPAQEPVPAQQPTSAQESQPAPAQESQPKPDDAKPQAPEESTQPALESQAVSGTFADVPSSHWAYGTIKRAARLGLVSGYSGTNTFGPDRGISRAQVATILWRMAGMPKPKAGASERPFTDVAPSDYFAKAVAWAASRGVVSGYAGERAGQFGPHDAVTREQFVTMVANYARRVARLDTSGYAQYYFSMVDHASVSSYAVQSMAWCFRYGLISGASGYLKPKAHSTRAEACKMILRIYDRATSPWKLTATAPATSMRKGSTARLTPHIAGDAGELSWSYALSIGSHTWASSSPSFYIGGVGAHTLTVTATDKQGRTQCATACVSSYELSGISVSARGNSSWFASAKVGVYDNWVDNVQYRFTWARDGGGSGEIRGWSADPNTLFGISTLGTRAGTYTITVEARDGAGYLGSRSTRITVTKTGYQNPLPYYQLSALDVQLPYSGGGIFGYVTPSGIPVNAGRSLCVETFVRRAYDYLGTPYIWDYACAPGVGVDCAGLVLQCLYAVGISPNKYTPYDHYFTPGHDHYAVDMRYDGGFKQIPFSERSRGDLIFYEGHVAIYLGNDMIINAVDPTVNVTIQSVYSWPVLSCSRVFT